MRLSDAIVQSVKDSGVNVYFADRRTTKIWNRDRSSGEPIQYGGWYWNRSVGGRVVETDTEGPFRSESAAVRDAYVKLQLRPSQKVG